MNGKLRQWVDRIDAMSLRERALVLLALLFLAWSLWDNFLMRPLDQQHKALRAQIDDQTNNNLALEKQIEEISLRQSQDPDAENRAKQEQLRAEIATLDAELQERTQALINPAVMSQVLEEVLSQQDGLRLVRMENLSAKPLLNGGGEAEAASASMPGIYLHGLEMELRGSYLGTLDYLRALEALPWRLYWDAVDLQVSNYPEATVKIQVHTLSLRAGWIGL